MADSFSGFAGGVESPASNALAVTASATALAQTTRALYIGADGSITVTMAGGGSVTFAGLTAGTLLPVRVTHVTAGTGVIALW